MSAHLSPQDSTQSYFVSPYYLLARCLPDFRLLSNRILINDGHKIERLMGRFGREPFKFQPRYDIGYCFEVWNYKSEGKAVPLQA